MFLYQTFPSASILPPFATTSQRQTPRSRTSRSLPRTQRDGSSPNWLAPKQQPFGFISTKNRIMLDHHGPIPSSKLSRISPPSFRVLFVCTSNPPNPLPTLNLGQSRRNKRTTQIIPPHLPNGPKTPDAKPRPLSPLSPSLLSSQVVPGCSALRLPLHLTNRMKGNSPGRFPVGHPVSAERIQAFCPACPVLFSNSGKRVKESWE